MQGRPHHRTDAVGADQGISDNRAGRGVRNDAVGALPESGDPASGAHGVGAEAFAHRAEQHHLQPPAVYRQLRVRVARGRPAGFGEQQLAAMGVEANR